MFAPCHCQMCMYIPCFDVVLSVLQPSPLWAQTAASPEGFRTAQAFCRLLAESRVLVGRTKTGVIWDTGSCPLPLPSSLPCFDCIWGSYCWLLNLNSPNLAMRFSAWNFFHLAVCQHFCLLNRLQGMMQLPLFCLAFICFPFSSVFWFCFGFFHIHCFILDKAATYLFTFL